MILVRQSCGCLRAIGAWSGEISQEVEDLTNPLNRRDGGASFTSPCLHKFIAHILDGPGDSLTYVYKNSMEKRFD